MSVSTIDSTCHCYTPSISKFLYISAQFVTLPDLIIPHTFTRSSASGLPPFDQICHKIQRLETIIEPSSFLKTLTSILTDMASSNTTSAVPQANDATARGIMIFAWVMLALLLFGAACVLSYGIALVCSSRLRHRRYKAEKMRYQVVVDEYKHDVAARIKREDMTRQRNLLRAQETQEAARRYRERDQGNLDPIRESVIHAHFPQNAAPETKMSEQEMPV